VTASTVLSERAEFYLCLARAFLAPKEGAAYRAFARYLADDLEDLSGRLGYPVSSELVGLRAAAETDHLALLQAYSRLFLAPPAPVHINAGFYLDGAIMGGGVAAMEAWYRRHGVERSERLHDLSDHVSVQLEFVAYLYAADAAPGAEQFLDAFVRRWLPPFCADLERAAARCGAAAASYLHLARLLRAAVECDAAPAPEGKTAPEPSAPAFF